MNTDAVLADIDGALAAYGTADHDAQVSPDAMRWTPEKPGKPQYLDLPALTSREAGIRIDLDFSEFAAAMESLCRALGAWGSVMSRAAYDTAPLVAAAFGHSWEDGKLHYHVADASRRVRRRCPVCHPRGFQPRCPDGEYYHRRQLARRRRNRRRR